MRRRGDGVATNHATQTDRHWLRLLACHKNKSRFKTQKKTKNQTKLEMENDNKCEKR